VRQLADDLGLVFVDSLCLLCDVEERHREGDLHQLLSRSRRQRSITVKAGACECLGTKHGHVACTNHRVLRVVDRANLRSEELEPQPPGLRAPADKVERKSTSHIKNCQC
jgi:hypothetical protein